MKRRQIESNNSSNLKVIEKGMDFSHIEESAYILQRADLDDGPKLTRVVGRISYLEYIAQRLRGQQ